MKYINRDKHWVEVFNSIVLDETERDTPLAERVMFFGIAASNLQEFMQVRYPAEVEESDPKELEEFADSIAKFYEKMIKRWTKFNDKHEIVRPVKDLKNGAEKWVQKTFKSEVFPTLQPVTIDRSKTLHLHPGKYIMVVTQRENDDKDIYNYIEIPKGLDRYIAVPDKHYCVDVIDLIQDNLKFMFKDRKIIDSYPFAISRSAEVYDQIDHDLGPIQMIQKTLTEREKSWITTLEVGTTDKKSVKRLRNLLPLGVHTIIFASKSIGLYDLKKIPSEIYEEKDKMKKNVRYNTFPKTSIFDYIRKQDRLAFHPFESYDNTMVRFLQEAAEDPDVVSIKISLYRVSDNSKIIDALLRAAEQGKAVTVLIELKARFDEHHNIEISKILREGGVRIAFTSPNMKTHAKVCIITRKEKKGLRTYCQVGTGNYSESNAKQYTDYSYFTANEDMGYDLTRFFDLMTSDQGTFKSRQVIYAPYNMRDTIMDEIKKEVKHAKNGKPARIICKCNSFTDIKLADALVDAAKAGVKITMIVRGACILEPSKRIKIYSIVGHYLEHSRLYCFGEGKHARIYLGSADLMTRNLSMRHELLILVEQEDIRKRLIRHLKWYQEDNTNRRVILPKYKYEDVKPKKDEKHFSAQEQFAKEAKKLGLDN